MNGFQFLRKPPKHEMEMKIFKKCAFILKFYKKICFYIIGVERTALKITVKIHFERIDHFPLIVLNHGGWLLC